MKTAPMRLVTIIAEALLEDRLAHDLASLGAKGWTVSAARGAGASGNRASDWEGGNVRIETIVTPEVADAILAHLADAYFPLYGVIAYASDIEVVRADKYR